MQMCKVNEWQNWAHSDTQLWAGTGFCSVEVLPEVTGPVCLRSSHTWREANGQGRIPVALRKAPDGPLVLQAAIYQSPWDFAEGRSSGLATEL